MRIATGTYIGDGVDDRVISGVGFDPKFVITRALTGGGLTNWKTTALFGTTSALWDGTSGDLRISTGIKSLGTGSFTLGTDASVNSSGITYHWFAFGADNAAIQNIATTGNGTDDRVLSGLLFTADAIFGGQVGASGVPLGFWFRSKAGDNTFQHVVDAGPLTDRFQDAPTNAVELGLTYNTLLNQIVFTIFKDKAGNVEQGSYVGDGLDDRKIVQADPFTPQVVFIRKEGSSRLVYRQDTLVGDATFKLGLGGTAINKIQAFNGSGFQIGSDIEVNESGFTYHYISFGSVLGEFINPIGLENVLIGKQENLCKGL